MTLRRRKRRLTSQEKKKLSYQKDIRICPGESEGAFRKGWPLKKRKKNKALRRAQHVADDSVAGGDPDDHLEAKVLNKAVKNRLEKWGIYTLSEAIALGRANRIALRHRRRRRTDR